ncbi:MULTISPECIES: DUF4138 domain-containing protein [unclassified Carboxylicivirga]|uniref:DUF4138 domain-containing protein n=1 Tax=Carboxylicivirga TaxID=1628153 RepID=UPI003D339C77
MKTPIITILLLSLFISLKAQNHIQVAEHSTVHLLCPVAVSYVQVGSHAKLMAEPVPDYPHVLRIKAVETFADSTSLTLVCGNQLYAFQVSYNSQCPLQLKLYDFKGEGLKEQPNTNMPLHQLLACMHQLQIQQASNRPIQSLKKHRIELSLDDIRVRQGLLFVRLTIFNHSNLIYNTEVPSLLMRDKKPKKAANVQEYGIEPIRTSSSELSIQPQKTQTLVLVFKSFSIPKHKEVEISLREQVSGFTGRDLSLRFGRKAIDKAKAL